MTSNTADTSAEWCSLVAIVAGSLALMLALFHFWAGPFAPQKSVERSIAEIAVNISKEVVRVAKKEPAILKERSWNTDDIVRIAVGVLGGVALCLAAIGFARRESVRAVVAAACLGGGAIGFQFVTWMALVVAGLVLIWIVVSNLGEILGG